MRGEGEGEGEGLPGRRLEVVQLVLRVGDRIEVVHHLALRRLTVLHREEGEGEGDARVRRANVERHIARLDRLAAVHVVPRHVRHQQVAELSRLVLRLGVERRVRVEVRHGFHQVPRVVLVQDPTCTDAAGAERAKSLAVGAPAGAALATGHQPMEHSLIILGFSGRKGEHFAFEGVDGEHAWKAWSATTFLLRFADYSLAHFPFQFLFEFDGFQGGVGVSLSVRGGEGDP